MNNWIINDFLKRIYHNLRISSSFIHHNLLLITSNLFNWILIKSKWIIVLFSFDFVIWYCSSMNKIGLSLLIISKTYFWNWTIMFLQFAIYWMIMNFMLSILMLVEGMIFKRISSLLREWASQSILLAFLTII